MAEQPKSTMKRTACGDVVPGCSFTASAATDDELLKKVVAATIPAEVQGSLRAFLRARRRLPPSQG